MVAYNSTLDVAIQGCINNFNQTACIRNCFLVAAILLTLLVCIIRICKLHLVKHPQVHQYIIFYLASVECLLCAANWIVGGSHPQIDISASYFKLLQFITMCHFYWTLAARILHKQHLVYRVIVPILTIYALYFTIVSGFSIAFVVSSWVECLKPEWLMMSAAEFLVVQLFMVAGHYITIKINNISAIESFKTAQKRDLWSLIIVFELSALISLIYDVTMNILGNSSIGCSGIFGHQQLSYSLIFAAFMVIKFMIPIWVMLSVFKIHPTGFSEDEERFLHSTETEASTSVFDTGRPSNNYKHLHRSSSNSDMNSNRNQIPQIGADRGHQNNMSESLPSVIE